MRVHPAFAFRITPGVARVAVYPPGIVGGVACGIIQVFGIAGRVRLFRILCGRNLDVPRVDENIALCGRVASLDLCRTAGFDDEVPASEKA